MSRRLTAADRSALIRLASTLPVGSEERRAILAGLMDRPEPQFDVGRRLTLIQEGYFKSEGGRYGDWLNAGTKGVIDAIEWDGGGWEYIITVKHTPGQYADDPRPHNVDYRVSERGMGAWK